MITLLGITLALGLGVQIGGNNAGVSTGVAYGARLLSRWPALVLAAIFELAGALTLGPRVTETIASGLIPAGHADVHFLLTIPLVALVLIGLANLLRTPIATTHAVVASIFGVGLALGELHGSRPLVIVGWWLATPLAAGLLAYVAWRPLRGLRTHGRTRRALGVFVVLAGLYVSFSSGANNAGNTAGPLSRGLGLDPFVSTAVAGVAMSVGMLAIGHRVMRTVSHGLTTLCEVRGAIVAIVSGTILIVASVLGVPVSLAETITGAVIGISLASHGAARTWRNENVRRIAVVWTTSPFAAAGTSFLMACMPGLR